jgi:type IV pilus assembly protein PilQ
MISAHAARPPNRIGKLVVRDEGSKTVLVLPGTTTPTFTVYKLERPERIVLDLAGATLSPVSDGPVEVSSWAVGQVSISEQGSASAPSVRVTIGLARSGGYRVKTENHNLVVTVTATEPKPEVPSLEEAEQKKREADTAAQAAERARAEAVRERQEAEKTKTDAERTRSEAERTRSEAHKTRGEAQRLVAEANDRMASAQQREEEARQRVGQAEEETQKVRAEQKNAERLAAAAEKRQREAAAAEVRAEERRKAAQAAAEQAEARAREAEARGAADARGVAEVKKKRAQAEEAVRKAEARRKEAEAAQALAETRRAEADARRQVAEDRRSAAENKAKLADHQRQEADVARTGAEQARDQALGERARAESGAKQAILAQEREQERVRSLAELRRNEEQRTVAAQAARQREEAAVRLATEARERAETRRAEVERALGEVATLRQREETARADATRRREEAEKAAAHAETLARTQSASTQEVRDAQVAARESRERRKTADEQAARARRELDAVEQAVSAAKQARDQAVADAKASRDEADKAHKEREADEQQAQKVKAEKTAEEQKLVLAKQARVAEEAKLAAVEKQRSAAQHPPESTPRPAAAPPPPRVRVREVDYVDRPGTARVVLAFSGPVEPRLVEDSGRQAIVELDGVDLAANLERSLDTSDFGGPVRAVSSYRDLADPNKVRIAVDLAEPTRSDLHRSGTTWYWDFKKPQRVPASAVAAAAPMPKTTAYAAPVVGAYGAASPPILAQMTAQKRKVYRGRRIEVDFKDVDIHNLLRLLADVGGVNIVIPDDIRATVTVRLRGVPWDQAMEVILESKALWYRREGNLIRVAPRKELDAEDQAEAERIRARMQSEPPEPEVFTLNYAEADALSAQATPLLSPRGKIEVDARTNSLVVNDLAAHRARIIRLLTLLDTQTPQIQIEARVVEARSSFRRDFGIQWGFGAQATSASGNATGLIFPSDVTVRGGASSSSDVTGGLGVASPDFAVNLPIAAGSGSGGAVGFSFGSVGGAFNLSLRLSAAEDSGMVRIVSAPKITVLNNAQATISQGVSIPISVVSAQGVQTQFVPADLQLQVTPHVSQRDCSIQMDVEVTKNEADFGNTGARGDPSILRKEAHTSLLIGDGETTVIGGIYTRNSSLSYAKVPFLADLPIVGWFFKNRREKDDRTEVLIFITPKITNKASLRCESRAEP